MKTDNQATVKFSKEFITPSGFKEWVGIEWPVSADTKEDVYKALDEAQDFVCGWWHSRQGPQATAHSIIQQGPITPDPEFEELKRRLAHMEYREDAINLINNNGFRLNVELNKIANDKPARPTSTN